MLDYSDLNYTSFCLFVCSRFSKVFVTEKANKNLGYKKKKRADYANSKKPYTVLPDFLKFLIALKFQEHAQPFRKAGKNFKEHSILCTFYSHRKHVKHA